MAQTLKPQKRSPELAPLSREHHESLLFVWKLRQGLAKNIDVARLTAFVQWFWMQHLATHFQDEEQTFSVVLAASNPLLQQMFREHEEIKNLVTEVVAYGVLKKLEALAQQLNDHIRFEERQLFGEVERIATPEQLQTVSEHLHTGKKNAIWEDEFWVAA